MHILYNLRLFSSYSALYWHRQPYQQLILTSWKCWQATHIERRQKMLHLHISQTNTLTIIMPRSPYFPSFHLTNGEEFRQPSLYLLQLFKTIPGCHNRVDILKRIFSVLMEAYNLSQKSECPHFCDSIRNISIKTHILYKRVARHMQNSLHRWYSHIGIPIIDLTSFCGWQSILTVSYLFWYLPQ